MRNIGKLFEEDFKHSANGMYYLRLHDSATGFDFQNQGNDHSVRTRNGSSGRTLRFSIKSPYDAVLCKNGQMCCVELKSVGGTSASFGDKDNNVIKLRQVKALLKAETDGHALSYLVIHFRKYGETYAIRPTTFLIFTKLCHKKSINRDDAKEIGKRIPERKLKVHYRYDLTVLFG